MQGVFMGHLSFYNKNQIIRKKQITLIILDYRRYDNEKLDGFK